MGCQPIVKKIADHLLSLSYFSYLLKNTDSTLCMYISLLDSLRDAKEVGLLYSAFRRRGDLDGPKLVVERSAWVHILALTLISCETPGNQNDLVVP